MNVAQINLRAATARWIGIGGVVCVAFAAGCSAHDPVNKTPYYHVGTPTNRASVESWELYNEPYYTQPGINRGDPVSPPKRLVSQRGYEPYDPLAESVYNALGSAQVNTKYISASAKNGVVILIGSVDNQDQLKLATRVAGKVTGVRQIRSELIVAKG